MTMSCTLRASVSISTADSQVLPTETLIELVCDETSAGYAGIEFHFFLAFNNYKISPY